LESWHILTYLARQSYLPEFVALFAGFEKIQATYIPETFMTSCIPCYVSLVGRPDCSAMLVRGIMMAKRPRSVDGFRAPGAGVLMLLLPDADPN
jgi:hypothetical protein